MPCYHPLKGFKIGKLASGKDDIKVVSYLVDHLELDVNGSIYSSTENFPSDRSVRTYRDWIQIPCGQCIGCRLDYSRQWANRCLMELQYHESSYFVTLTYDDVHVPYTFYNHDDSDEAVPALTLKKRDLQLFFKRLRSNTGQNIRYFACGEYGSTTARPHYHCIIFGLKLDDLVPYKRSHEGFQYYNSETVQRAWRNFAYDVYGNKIDGTYGDIGYAVVAEVSWETCAYTARYVTKKATGYEAEFYDSFNLQREFAVMSRKPGIASKYYDDHKDEIYGFDHFSIPTKLGGRQITAPRYFDQKFDIDDPERMRDIKVQRKEIVERLNNMRMQQTGKSYLELLADQETTKLAKIKSLKRSEV